jgi:sortase A
MSVLRRRLLLLLEGGTWFFGVAGLAGWGTYHLWAAAAARRDVARFVTHQDVAPRTATPDQSLWSPERIVAWRKAVGEPAATPLAVLRIPRLRLEVPVLPGTDDRTLDRAVGHIDDTALPGADGNSGIAGHRDGFFRGLKDIAEGDVIELETAKVKEVYRVERTWVVDPEDVSVLDPTPTRALTLVTCYPFYYIGPAPRRFIVRAVLVRAHERSVNNYTPHGEGDGHVTQNYPGSYGGDGRVFHGRHLDGTDDDKLDASQEVRGDRGQRQRPGRQAAGRHAGNQRAG